MLKFFKLWVPVIVWGAVIFYFSDTPYLKTGLEYDYILRKLAHIFEYLILTLLLYRAFKGSFKMHKRRVLIYPALVSFLYAASDELHQYFVPGRSCAIKDVLIDIIGILGCYISIKILSDRRRAYILAGGLE
ncbi:MAG: VanZ family protein [Candidatus Omnitrophota bacterium]|nr:VanZ family protein [Candidatus Omnitrophota bacterium]